MNVTEKDLVQAVKDYASANDLSAELTNIGEAVVKLSVGDYMNLITMFEEVFGVKADAVAAAPAAGDEAAVQEKSTFELILDNAGAQKIKVIKALKEMFKISLGDAKAKAETDGVSLGEFSKEDAEAHKETLVAVGAKVTLK